MSEVGAQVDEQRIAKGVAIGLPIVTLSVASVVGVLMGPATSILVLAAGLLLGVISLLWGSLRVLSGDAPLSPELEALEMAAHGVDALSVRKKMLLRALKDLSNEHAIGKIETDDFEALSTSYRAELKSVMKKIDSSLAPHRARAEEAARAHLLRAGIVQSGYRGEPPPSSEPGTVSAKETSVDHDREGTARVTCPKCGESNEPDAKFCKECATKLGLREGRRPEPHRTEEDAEDEA